MASSRIIISEQPIDRNQRQAALDGLEALGANRGELGLTYGDIFLAIGKGEDEFSVRGVCMSITGRVFKILGEYAGCVFLLIGIAMVASTAASVAGSVVKWFASFLKDASNDYDEQKDATSDMAGATMSAMLLGLFPAWIAAPLTAIIKTLLGSIGAAPGSLTPEQVAAGSIPSTGFFQSLLGGLFPGGTQAVNAVNQAIGPPSAPPSSGSGGIMAGLGGDLLKWGVGKLLGVKISDEQTDRSFGFENTYGRTIDDIRAQLRGQGIDA